jgi:hypothetical protein
MVLTKGLTYYTRGSCRSLRRLPYVAQKTVHGFLPCAHSLSREPAGRSSAFKSPVR